MAVDVRARGKIAQFHHPGRRGICSCSFLPELDPLEETERARENEGGMTMTRPAWTSRVNPAAFQSLINMYISIDRSINALGLFVSRWKGSDIKNVRYFVRLRYILDSKRES